MKFLIAIVFFTASAMAVAAQGGTGELKTVPRVELNKYAGKWYEIARYPNKFQKACVGNTTATYTLKDKGKIEVLNQCLKKDGLMNSAKGEAKVADKATNAKLKVRFAPGILSFLPFVWGNYWIIELGSDYDHVVIGEPDRKYFWIMSRKPEMNDKMFQAILRRAEAMGYNPAKVERTPQNVETLKGGVIERN